MTSTMRKRAILVVGIIAATAVGVGWRWSETRWPKRFAAVVDGKLYRSGEVRPGQLERLQSECGIQRVICLLAADAPGTLAEKAEAQRLGIEWHNIPLRGDGSSGPDDRERILALLGNADAPPTLVHCAAGVNRTGLAVGLYRLRYQGWSVEDALAEMRTFGFEDLPKHENLRQALMEEAGRTATKK